MTEEQKATQNRLMHVFMDTSGVHSLPSKFATRNESWFKPLQALAEACEWDADRAEDLIRDAVRQMNKDRLNMKCPASIVNIALGIKRRGKESSDGWDDAWKEL